MRYKLMTGFFMAAVGISGACVNVSVSDDDNGGGSGGNSSSGSTGASGVSSSKRATDFTPAEQQTFCEWLEELAAPKVGEYDCGEGLTVTIESYSAAQCEEELAKTPGCPVSDLEGCFETLIEDPCLIFSEAGLPECAGLEQCADDTGSTDDPDNNLNPNSTSTTEFCYDHDCNGDATGEQCFSTEEAYCASLCTETNCISVEACEVECL